MPGRTNSGPPALYRAVWEARNSLIGGVFPLSGGGGLGYLRPKRAGGAFFPAKTGGKQGRFSVVAGGLEAQ
ncbi:protein of unknown function [Magnetospirillum sp. XM-1]|nr:protein of unknown function [Magnetospirillum sp. XM-1]